MINSSFIVQSHIKSLYFMLITKLNNYSIIIDKSWMNKHEIILNIMYDKLIFVSDRCFHWETSQVKLNCNSIFSIKSSSSIKASINSSSSPTVSQGFKSILKYKILKRKSILYPSFNVVTKDTQSIRSVRSMKKLVKINSKSSNKRQEFLNIVSIKIETYYQWAENRDKKQRVKCFVMIMYDINAALKVSHFNIT